MTNYGSSTPSSPSSKVIITLIGIVFLIGFFAYCQNKNNAKKQKEEEIEKCRETLKIVTQDLADLKVRAQEIEMVADRLPLKDQKRLSEILNFSQREIDYLNNKTQSNYITSENTNTLEEQSRIKMNAWNIDLYRFDSLIKKQPSPPRLDAPHPPLQPYAKELVIYGVSFSPEPVNNAANIYEISWPKGRKKVKVSFSLKGINNYKLSQPQYTIHCGLYFSKDRPVCNGDKIILTENQEEVTIHDEITYKRGEPSCSFNLDVVSFLDSLYTKPFYLNFYYSTPDNRNYYITTTKPIHLNPM